jgi:hypothetical protein
VCPKVKPGHSDLTPQASEVFWHWWYCNKLDEHPQEIEARRFRRILDAIRDEIDKSHDESRMGEMMAMMRRMMGK